jgi:hypothetical protein
MKGFYAWFLGSHDLCISKNSIQFACQNGIKRPKSVQMNSSLPLSQFMAPPKFDISFLPREMMYGSSKEEKYRISFTQH